MEKKDKRILILIVEDEKILAEALKDKLESEGFSVLNAYDGSEGLQFAIKKNPDLILLDLLMPKVSGLEMLKRLQEKLKRKDIEIIILTNVNDPAKIAKGIEVCPGVICDYLLKTDMSLEDIVLKIKKKLEIKN